MSKKHKSEFINREISWLAFNERVLQEAADKTVPLIERIRFLGIYSNNLDEFFKVRVATLRRASSLTKKSIDPMDFDPKETLVQIDQIVSVQQAHFDLIYADLLKLLEQENILLINDKKARKTHLNFIEEYFKKNIKPNLIPIILSTKIPFPQLSDNRIYLALELYRKSRTEPYQYALLELPKKTRRFVVLPGTNNGKTYVMYVDDIIRMNMHELFTTHEYDHINAYALKTTRDAELDIDDDLSKSFVEKMSRSLRERKKGQYVRINYDSHLPPDFAAFILKKIRSKSSQSVTPGDRYQSKKDLMHFPDFERKDLTFAPLHSAKHPSIKENKSMFEAIRKGDILLHFPYHSFNSIIDLLREASQDTHVRTIRITLYRVAQNSQIVNALINAIRNGKQVIAVIELQARFDEENNIAISKMLQESGVRVIPGVPGLKVHGKLIQISRKEGTKTVRYTHIGTGNFHEKTSLVYTDISLLTIRKEIGSEVRRMFEFFENNFQRMAHRHLIVSPFGTRRKFTELINNEITFAEKGKPAWITIKMNNLVDASMIRKLYEASEAGVKIKLIIRGICSLIPGIKGKSENIEVISIIGRFLEHSRIISFGNGGKPLYYISSADWMVRNIDHRIEVTCPIYDEKLKTELQNFLDIQLSPNAKARLVESTLENKYIIPLDNKSTFDVQLSFYNLLKKADQQIV